MTLFKWLLFVSFQQTFSWKNRQIFHHNPIALILLVWHILRVCCLYFPLKIFLVFPKIFFIFFFKYCTTWNILCYLSYLYYFLCIKHFLLVFHVLFVSLILEVLLILLVLLVSLAILVFFLLLVLLFIY